MRLAEAMFSKRQTGQALLAPILCAILAPALLRAESRGQAELSAQGYYLGTNGALSGLSGLDFRFQHFVDNLGLLDGRFENYGGQGHWRFGENYLELREMPWMSHRWRLTGGDFRTPTRLVEFPAASWNFPELSLRGTRISAARRSRQYSAFYGVQTLPVGPRVSFRVSTPQRVAGATFRYSREDRLTFGVSAYRISTDLTRADDYGFLIPESRRFKAVNNASVQTSFRASRNFQLFGEAAWARPAGAAGASRPWSTSAGALWDSPRFYAQVNYLRQGALYLPAAGYFAGDRAGPFAEVRVRPAGRLQLYGSASRYSNNLERNPATPTFRTSSRSGGAFADLPLGFSAGFQISDVHFEALTSGLSPADRSRNRMWSADLGRSAGRHYLRGRLRAVTLRGNASPQRQRSLELEDHFHWRNLTLGGGVRLDRSIQDQVRNSVFARGNAQLRLPRLTLFGQFEHGRDLLSSSVFTTSAVKAIVAGVSASLPGGWTVHTEVFRHDLNLSLNPASIFLLESRGVPYPVLFSGLNQWSLFFRFSKSLSWGGPMPSQGLERWTAERLPIAGSVEGMVYAVSRSGKAPAPGVTVRLDDNRTALTDAAGRYRFAEVPEGAHTISLEMRLLPADYEPGSPAQVQVSVRSRAVTRQDFHVARLTDLCGSIQGPAGSQLDSIVLNLQPLGIRTTPEADGTFCFYNLREGPYEIWLDPRTLPQGFLVDGPERLPVVLDRLAPPPPPVFRLEPQPDPARPVRLIQASAAPQPPVAGQ